MAEIHLSEASRKYGISKPAIHKWAKEHPERTRKVKNLLMIDEAYIIEKVRELQEFYESEALRIRRILEKDN